MTVDLQRLFSLEPEEGSWDLEVEGELPSDLRATIMGIGPGCFSRPDRRLAHWLDGDGFVSMTQLEPGKAPRLTTRFVDTQRRREELAAGHAIYRGFGTKWEGDALLRGVAAACPNNVSVCHHGGRLLAWGEQGLPLELDPDNLETRGDCRFGRLNAMSPMAAHPKLDPRTDELVFFGQSFSRRRPTLTVYSADRDGELSNRWRADLEIPAMIHDFAVSEHHVAVHVGPYEMEVDEMLGAGASVVDSLHWKPEEKSRLLVFDRASGERLAEIELEEPYCLHIINAYDADESTFVVDLLSLAWPVYGLYMLPEIFDGAPEGWPVRLRIDLGSGEVERTKLQHGLSPDLPAVDPRRLMSQADRVWMLDVSSWREPGSGIFDRVVSCDFAEPDRLDSWSAKPGRCLGLEPVVLPTEDRRYLAVFEVDPIAERSDLLIFDADRLADGPLARMKAPFVPVQFHSEGLVHSA